jgi:hypothetical protein
MVKTAQSHCPFRIRILEFVCFYIFAHFIVFRNSLFNQVIEVRPRYMLSAVSPASGYVHRFPAKTVSCGTNQF